MSSSRPHPRPPAPPRGDLLHSSDDLLPLLGAMAAKDVDFDVFEEELILATWFPYLEGDL